MTEEPKSDQTVPNLLNEIRSQVMGPLENNEASAEASVPSSGVETMHIEQLLQQVNEEWNLTEYDLTSNRKNYAQIVTTFKKTLDLLLKPYANIFLYQQATYNSHVVQILNLLAQKLGRIEGFLCDISQEQTALRDLMKSRLDESHLKLDQLSHEVRERHENMQDMLMEGFAASRDNLEAQRDYVEHLQSELSENMEENQRRSRESLSQGFEEQQQYVDALHEQIMGNLSQGMKIALTDIAKRLQVLSKTLESNRQQLDDKIERNVDTLLDILSEGS